MSKEEEIEHEKDEFFEGKENRERAELAKKCDNNEPQETMEEFEELNKDANELLINKKRMKKKEFAKKLDIYFIVMKKKLINNPKNTVN